MTNTQSPAPGVAAEEFRDNTLKSVANWLRGRSNTAWAEKFKYTGLMQEWADDLDGIRTALQASVAAVEPAGWMRPDELQKAKTQAYLCRVHPEKDKHLDMVPVYTAPPLPAQVQEAEVTDELADEIANACYRELLVTTTYSGGMGGLTWDRALVRAAIFAARAPLGNKYPVVKIEDCELIEFDSDLPDGEFALVPLSDLASSTPAPGMAGGVVPEELARAMEGPLATPTDAEIIGRCTAAGLHWIEPDGEEDGFPGAFDMVYMSAMRKLLAPHPSPAPQAAGANPCQHDPIPKVHCHSCPEKADINCDRDCLAVIHSVHVGPGDYEMAGWNKSREGIHELFAHEDADPIPGLEGDKPFCRFVYYVDNGDPSVGEDGRQYWALAPDQSGTELADLLARTQS